MKIVGTLVVLTLLPLISPSIGSNWQQDVNDHAIDQDYELSIWVRELLESCLDTKLQKLVNDKFDLLDA